MIPNRINIINVYDGDRSSLPDIICKLRDVNQQTCEKAGINYVWHHFPWDKKFRTCAIQAEYMKLVFLSSVRNEIVADWDVLFSGDIFLSECIKIGCRKKTGPDSFLVYMPGEYNGHVFTDFLRVSEKNKVFSENGFSKKLFEKIYDKKEIHRFPEKYYHHLNTRFSAVESGGWRNGVHYNSSES